MPSSADSISNSSEVATTTSPHEESFHLVQDKNGILRQGESSQPSIVAIFNTARAMYSVPRMPTDETRSPDTTRRFTRNPSDSILGRMAPQELCKLLEPYLSRGGDISRYQYCNQSERFLHHFCIDKTQRKEESQRDCEGCRMVLMSKPQYDFQDYSLGLRTFAEFGETCFKIREKKRANRSAIGFIYEYPGMLLNQASSSTN